MTVAAFLIGFISGEPLIASIGMCLGKGTLISIACVMTVLPALLYLLDKPLEKTVFRKRERIKRTSKRNLLTQAVTLLGRLSAPPPDAADGTPPDAGAKRETETTENKETL